MLQTPAFIAPSRHATPESAVHQIRQIYEQQVGHVRDAVQAALGDPAWRIEVVITAAQRA